MACPEGPQRLEVGLGQADVEAPPVDDQAVEAVLLAQAVERGGELELAPLAHVVADVLLEVVEELRLDHVLAEDGQVLAVRQARHAQVAARVVDGGLLGELGDVEQPVGLDPDAGRRAEVGDLAFGRAAQADDAGARALVGLHQLPRAGHGAVRAVDVVAQHQQERLVPQRRAGAVDRVAEALLGRLGHERDAAPDLEDPAGVLLGLARQLVEVLDRDLVVEERLEVLEVLLLHDDDHLLDARLERFLDDQQDRGLGDAVPVDDREQLLLRRLAGREEPRAEAGGRDERFADLGARGERQRQGGEAQVALEDLDHGCPGRRRSARRTARCRRPASRRPCRPRCGARAPRARAPGAGRARAAPRGRPARRSGRTRPAPRSSAPRAAGRRRP